jgi:hypothetical protein
MARGPDIDWDRPGHVSSNHHRLPELSRSNAAFVERYGAQTKARGSSLDSKDQECKVLGVQSWLTLERTFCAWLLGRG